MLNKVRSNTGFLRQKVGTFPMTCPAKSRMKVLSQARTGPLARSQWLLIFLGYRILLVFFPGDVEGVDNFPGGILFNQPRRPYHVRADSLPGRRLWFLNVAYSAGERADNIITLDLFL